MSEPNPWFEGTPIPALLRHARNNYGIAMLDGFVAAIVAGPATYEPLGWLCPLLGVTRDAINNGDTKEYAALAAAAQHHNALSATLSEAPAPDREDRTRQPHRPDPPGEQP